MVIRRLFPGWRYACIDTQLSRRMPGAGVYCTNGRIVWGRREAELFASAYVTRHLGMNWEHESADAAVRSQQWMAVP